MIKNLPIRLAQVGKIKIGIKGEERTGKSGASYSLPNKVDYFIITKLEKEGQNFKPDYNLMKRLDPQGKPRKLKIALPYDDIDLNFFTEYSLYAGKKRICFGDGVEATRIYLDKETKKEIKREKLSCPCNFLKEGKCKPHGILSVILRDNFQLGGVYQFRTTSYNSIQNILSGLMQIQQMTQGILAMVPLIMSLQPQSVIDKEGKLRTIYAVNITADVQEWRELLNIAKDIARIRSEAVISIKQLESATRSKIIEQRQETIEIPPEETEEEIYTPIKDEENSSEQADVNEEFSPQTIEEDDLLFIDGENNNGLPFEKATKNDPGNLVEKKNNLSENTKSEDDGNNKSQDSLF